MRFCANCGRAMVRDPSSGVVVYRCACGAEEKGAPEDARVAGAVLNASETLDMYAILIRGASLDRTNQLVMQTCADCGLDYKTQIRVGSSEVIIYTCKCGAVSTGAPPAPGEPPAPAPGAPAPGAAAPKRL